MKAVRARDTCKCGSSKEKRALFCPDCNRKYHSLEASFWRNCEPPMNESGCWEWSGKRRPAGYGVIWDGGKEKLAHRVSYELFEGVIPDGLDLDHLCRNRICVRPAHLEPVTRQENLLRGQTIPAKHAAKTACPQGHPYDAKDCRGARICMTCKREHCRNTARKRRASQVEAQWQ